MPELAENAPVQGSVHKNNSILLLMLSNELILQSWLREKMLMAFFKISRSCRTRSNSRLS
jgi:hypothetical protein